MKIKSKLAALMLSGITLTSCTSNELVPASIEPQEIQEYVVEDTIEEEPTEEVVDTDSIEYNTNIINVVVADINTPIMDSVLNDGNKLGTLAAGRSFTLISDEDPEWYAIKYYGEYGFVKKEDTHIELKQVVNQPMIDKGYLPIGGVIYSDKDLTTEKSTLEELEFVEIYKDYGNTYLVSTLDYEVGFIKKEDINLLEGNLVVTDITNQEVVFYIDNKKVFTAPCVSGTINTGRATNLGLTEILSKWGAGEIAPGAYVRCVAYFNTDYEGFHTAEWRKPNEFGADIYTYDGSHGCINMRLDEALELCGMLEVGDKCLIKY